MLDHIDCTLFIATVASGVILLISSLSSTKNPISYLLIQLLYFVLMSAFSFILCLSLFIGNMYFSILLTTVKRELEWCYLDHSVSSTYQSSHVWWYIQLQMNVIFTPCMYLIYKVAYQVRAPLQLLASSYSRFLLRYLPLSYLTTKTQVFANGSKDCMLNRHCTLQSYLSRPFRKTRSRFWKPGSIYCHSICS